MEGVVLGGRCSKAKKVISSEGKCLLHGPVSISRARDLEEKVLEGDFFGVR